jgi:hypothetical protein
MRTLSFIAAFAAFLIGPSFAGIPDGPLPSIGSFTYHGAPIVHDGAATLVMAAR